MRNFAHNRPVGRVFNHVDFPGLISTLLDGRDIAEVASSGPNWPPYDIEEVSKGRTRITLALAGFDPDAVDITLEDRVLTVSGQPPGDDTSRRLIHRGIARRRFSQRFRLSDDIRVEGAAFENGLLTIDLVEEVPEERRPRKIPIAAAGTDRPVPDAPAVKTDT